MNINSSDAERGFYQKFVVSRCDGRSAPGQKHHRCEYFILDLTHDPHAWPALEAYMEACRRTHQKLAEDLRLKIAVHRAGFADAETGGEG